MNETSCAANVSPVQVALIGCGAVVQQYYAPALAELEKAGALEVRCLFDPNTERLAEVRAAFSGAVGISDLDAMAAGTDIAIVASPPRYHAEQAIRLMRSGVHVLCEKPMATTLSEAEAMNAVAAETGKVLAIGLFRRFFPASELIRQVISNCTLGSVRSFQIAEGGLFYWPAQSASFFQRSESGGGVLLDTGVHVLDLVHWWFGDPAEIAYADDAMGGLESNCLLTARFTAGFAGQIRLSRDTPLPNKYSISCERGVLTWRVGEANRLDVQFDGSPYVLRSDLYHGDGSAPSYHQSFVNQVRNFIAAVRGTEALRVSGAMGISSMRLVERCYHARTLLRMPWLSGEESARACELNAATLP